MAINLYGLELLIVFGGFAYSCLQVVSRSIIQIQFGSNRYLPHTALNPTSFADECHVFSIFDESNDCTLQARTILQVLQSLSTVGSSES